VVRAAAGDIQYAEFSQGLINKGALVLEQPVAFETHTLSDADAELLREHLDKAATGTKLLGYSLSIYKAMLTYAGTVFLTPIGIAVTALSTALAGMTGVATINSQTLLFVTAKGGSFTRSLLLTEKDGRYVAVDAVEYRVPVGDEFRHALLYSCTYPAIVILNAVRTLGLPNPKIFARVDEKTWVRKNAATDVVEVEYDVTAEDVDYVYLSEKGDIPEDLRSKIRVSRRNGPIQKKMSDNSWATLYQTTEGL
jgi:hypothetical protein